MRTILSLVVLSASLLGLSVGCGKDAPSSDKPGAAKTDDKGAKTDAKTDAAKPTKIAKLNNLSIDLPPDGSVSDGMGDNSVMVSTGQTTLTISVAKPTDPKTSADGKGAALATENMKIEKLTDGWYITSENTGSMGRNYWLTMRREIGGKGYLCETMQSNDAQVKAAIAVCKGLK
jgi:hypothetical protein